MKKIYGIVLAVLLMSCAAKASGNHTADTNGIPILEIDDPFGYKVVVYLWVIVVGLLGGISGYVRKLKNNYSRFSVAEVIGECVISVTVAIFTFWLCEWAHIIGPLQAAIIGISSHMGSRAMFQFENKLISSLKLSKIFLTVGNKLEETENGKSE